LSLPEEDIWVEGGTGVNHMLNGLYFKVIGSYGLPLYKLVKKMYNPTATIAMQKVTFTRFLWQDTKKGLWIISEKPMGGVKPGAGVAFVDDPAENPSGIHKTWYVWDQKSKGMRIPDEEHVTEDGKLKNKTDVIVSKSIVGFEVTGVKGTDGGPLPGLMLRQSSELYGRPVYEAESGAQFLYWMENGGSVEQGLKDPEAQLVKAADEEELLFSQAGCWILAKEMGVDKEHEACLGYVQDTGVTPDQVEATNVWKVQSKNKEEEAGTWSENPKLKLRMEEWTRADDVLHKFDSDFNDFDRLPIQDAGAATAEGATGAASSSG